MSDALFNGEEDKEPNLSQGWVTSSIGELFEIIGGGTPSTEIPSFWEGSIPWMTSADIHGLKDVTPRKKITSDAIDKSATHCVPKGSIIVVTRVGLGKIALAPTDLCFSQDCQALIGNWSYLIPEYCLYYLSGAVQIFKYKNRGTTISGVIVKQLRELNFPLPPLPEQHRIVAKIEELFTHLDAGVASLKKAQAQLKRYRQAVLKAAFEGRLTQEWREEHKGEIEPASELLKKISRVSKRKTTRKYERLVNGDTYYLQNLPDEWELTQVQEVGDVQLGRQRAPQHHNGPNMRPYLRVANVFENYIDVSDVKSMNFTPDEFEIYHLEYGDILLNEGQSKELVGRPAVFRNEIPDVCFQNTLVRFRAYNGLIPEFALQLFIAYLNNGQFSKIASQSTNIAHLGAERFAKMPFPLAPYLEQREILSEIDRHFSIISKINDNIENSLRQAETLRQSILKRAFEGKLVPQDPNDEPASVLLERIKAEKASRAAEGKKGKTLQRRSPKRTIKNAD